QIFLLMIGKHGHFRIGIHLCQQFQKCLVHSRASCRGFGAFSVFLCILPQGGFFEMNLLLNLLLLSCHFVAVFSLFD
ncbi:hypothetical protein, partial [Pyramidobacter piscolens]|uniref:hypothetical protein n=1 Tax=Pyramidobacter piscolens TaxID=638849 RepID=UPI00266D1105